MGQFAIRRLLLLVPQTLGVVTLIFVLFRLVPGDPALIVAGPNATQAQIDAIRRDLGLHRPLWAQYARFLTDLARGDLGISLSLRQPVTQVLKARLRPTVALMVCSLALAVLVAVPGGVMAAVRPHGLVAQGVMAASILALSIPNFLLGMLLMHYLSVRWRLLPAAGSGGVVWWRSSAGRPGPACSRSSARTMCAPRGPRAWGHASCSTVTPCGPP
jgi:ABC-type dipeptide/oligopeptide/nickel transport system permease component